MHCYCYSGDQDSVIPLTGSRTLVQKLARKLGLNSTVPYRVWFEGQQVCILITKVAFGTVFFFFVSFLLNIQIVSMELCFFSLFLTKKGYSYFLNILKVMFDMSSFKKKRKWRIWVKCRLIKILQIWIGKKPL